VRSGAEERVRLERRGDVRVEERRLCEEGDLGRQQREVAVRARSRPADRARVDRTAVLHRVDADDLQ
jgi:hypothetical protein